MNDKTQIMLRFMISAVVFTAFVLLHPSCTSKNRYEAEATQPLAEPDNKLNIRKGNLTEIESNAIPYLDGFGANKDWSLRLSFIQNEIYEAKLEKDKKVYSGLLKHFPSEDKRNHGEFYVGELQYNDEKVQVQFFVQPFDCTDLDNKHHKARITMLFAEKENYGCGDFLF